MRPRKKKNADKRIEKTSHLMQIQPENNKGNWREIMGKDKNAPLYLEIGCGKGTFACTLAAREPNACIIAVEKVKDVIVSALERAAEAELSNIRFIMGDAADLKDIFDKEEVDRIYINFCDPWHKNRHFKRRLTYRGFLSVYKQFLKKNGEIHFKTDNSPLFEFSLPEFEAAGFEVISMTRDLENENDAQNIVTEYESIWSQKGFCINRAIAKLKQQL